MILCECGNQRVGKAKFCSECGKQFILPNELQFAQTQSSMVSCVNEKISSVRDKIGKKIVLNEKDTFKQEYISVFKDIKNLLDFHIENIDSVIEQFFQQEARQVFLESIYLQHDASLFEKYTRVYDKNKEKRDEEVIIKLKNYITARKEAIERIYNKDKEYYPDQNFEDRRDSEIARHLGFEKLLDEGILLELLKFKHSSVMSKINEQNSGGNNTDIPKKEVNNDLLEILDFALAFTSPVSAARYVIKSLKNN